MLISRLKAETFESPPGGRAHDPVALTPMDRPVTRPLLTRGRGLAAGAVLVASTAAAYAYVQFGYTQFARVDAERLQIATVTHGVFHDFIPVTGTVVPRTTVYLDAVTGGQVARAHVEEGAAVKVGDPLVTLENAGLQLDVAGREAALAQQLYQLTTINIALDDRRLQRARELTEIEYQISQLTSQYERKKPLQASGYVSQMEIDDLERSLARHRSTYESVSAAQKADSLARPQQVKQLEQSIALITENLAMTRRHLEALVIKAPVGGHLSLLDADVGAAKAPGQRIGQIDSDDGFKVSAKIDEFYLPRLAVGQRATAGVDGGRHAFEVAKIYPGVEARQFMVDLRFTGAIPASLRRGQTLHLKLEIGEPGEGIVVANGEYYDDAGGAWVFVVAPSGASAARRPVTLGRRNPDDVEVLAGLKAGERVIVSSYAPYLEIERIDIQGKISSGGSTP